MDSPKPNLVPKTDPRSRLPEPEDPFELMAEPAAGDPLVMLECILQEFAWMGWNAEQLMSLFQNPGYPMLCDLRNCFGDAMIRRQVNALVERWGLLRFRETIVEPEFADDDHVELVQIDLSLPRGS